MAILKSPRKHPKSAMIQIRVEEEVKLNLDRYAAFLEANPSYVVSEALKLLFRKDADFKRWLDDNPDELLKTRPMNGTSKDN